MSFRLVPKSVTLNDLERRNGRYFALFQRIRVASGRTEQKFTFAISSPDEFLYPLVMPVLRVGPRTVEQFALRDSNLSVNAFKQEL